MANPGYFLAAWFGGCALLLGGCGGQPWGAQVPAPVAAAKSAAASARVGAGETPNQRGKANDVVLFALGLIETGYRFGGKNPDAGLDCSGMVSYVFEKSADMRLAGSAADLARLGRPVPAAQLRPGDLVFFNTQNRPHSHVGIYIGDDRFVHAPSSRGKVRTESLSRGWFAARFEEGRSYFE